MHSLCNIPQADISRYLSNRSLESIHEVQHEPANSQGPHLLDVLPPFGSMAISMINHIIMDDGASTVILPLQNHTSSASHKVRSSAFLHTTSAPISSVQSAMTGKLILSRVQVS